MSSPTANTESVPITHVTQNKSIIDEEIQKTNPNPLKPLAQPTRTIECNMVSYTDGEGAKKEIWMPKGTMHTALKHLEKKDWDALAKFPVWNNQKYAENMEAEEMERQTWEWLVVNEAEQVEKGT